MRLNLYFLRHGETIHSQTGGYCGALYPELPQAGMQMAQAFVDIYQALLWKAVFASLMKRTIATAQPLCEETGINPQFRDGLTEMYYGEDGRLGAGVERVAQEFDIQPPSIHYFEAH
ncbi:MAG: histidine phosphatase family protein [Cyanobacteria bacterium P01_F01_bin.116]